MATDTHAHASTASLLGAREATGNENETEDRVTRTQDLEVGAAACEMAKRRHPTDHLPKEVRRS